MDGADLAIDRISDLPDPLISQILSLLTTKEAVHTCILSKRWIDLWTSMDTLEFEYCISAYDCEDKFLRFFHGVQKRRGFSPLDKFKLSWQSRSGSNHHFLKQCINHAVTCMPRLIYIHIDMQPIFKLPDSLFNCGSVKEMSLFSWLDFYKCYPQRKSINLPSLQKLELGQTIVNDCFIRMLLMRCPVLEELVMTRCCLMMNEINSNVLKKLTIKNSYFICDGNSTTLKNASSLVKADVDLFDAHKLNILGLLTNVTSLRFYTTSGHVMFLLDRDISNCLIFDNLKCLELGELETCSHWNIVACFLQRSPNLNKLILTFRHSKFAVQEALPRIFSFQHDFLEIVEIRVEEENEEMLSEVVTTLGVLVKTIGKIVIL